MEIITKEGEKNQSVYSSSEDQDKKEGKRGKKVGIAYELDNGGNNLRTRIIVTLTLLHG